MTIQIKSILDELVLRRPEIKKKMREAESCRIWDIVLSENIRKNAQPAKVREGVLFVDTATAAWANELNFLKTEIIDKINNHMGESVIKDIFFKVSGKLSSKDK
ncbi:MAG: DUF721 domain-containing protein [bacterium]